MEKNSGVDFLPSSDTLYTFVYLSPFIRHDKTTLGFLSLVGFERLPSLSSPIYDSPLLGSIPSSIKHLILPAHLTDLSLSLSFLI